MYVPSACMYAHVRACMHVCACIASMYMHHVWACIMGAMHVVHLSI